MGLDQVALEGVLTGKAYGVKATQQGKLKYQPAVNEFYTLLVSEHLEMRRASQRWAERMLLTPRPLQEKLTLFWNDPFATSQEKVLNCEPMVGQIATLRKHAHGNFRELLIAAAQDPAMLIWLDNRDNSKASPMRTLPERLWSYSAWARGKATQKPTSAKWLGPFAGWTMRPIRRSTDKAQFIDDKRLHDPGEKTFLGAKGNFTGYDAIDIVLKQEATPRFLARELYRYFVREEISKEVNEQLAKLLVDSKYDLKPLLKTILLSRDFYSEPSVGTQIKSPRHFLVSTYRKLGLTSIPGIPDCVETSAALGQLLFFPPTVAGWPCGRARINPATLLARGNAMHTLLFPDPDTFVPPDKVVAEGCRKIPLDFAVKPIPRTTAQVDFAAMVRSANVATVEEAVDYFKMRFLSVDLHPARHAAMVAFLKKELNSDRLDYANQDLERALRRMVHLILSTPEYQLG